MMWAFLSLPQAAKPRRGEGGSTTLVVETGGAAQNSYDDIHHRIQFAIDFMIPEPQHSKPLAFQKRIAHSIAVRGVVDIMLPAINLDHDQVAKRHEVHDDMPDRRLPPEVKSERLEFAQLHPQFGFLRRQVLT